MRKPREYNGFPVEFICKTTQLAHDMAIYEEAPMRRDGRKLSWQEAHPEHWWTEPLQGRICTEFVGRMNDMCPNCNRIQWEWQKEYYAERKRKRQAEKGYEEPQRRGRH